jgi:malonyl CoA-acyl carrier protein transacylase
VSEPVRWLDCLSGMLRSDLLIEVGPGNTLSGMVKRLDRKNAASPWARPRKWRRWETCWVERTLDDG